ncbi:thermonuclease family protein [bacterium]|nr:thermonuclease family protein [bacterium]
MKSFLKTVFIFSVVIAITVTPVSANTLVIKKVHDGDTIECEGGFKAHISGVNTPDLDEKFGQKVFEFTKNELEGELVAVYSYTLNNNADGIVYDKDGYAFMKIMYGDDHSIDFGALLIKKGLARVDKRFPIDDLDKYIALEKEAKEKKVGIWVENSD